MKNIGVIGLGDMGSGIALNLIKNGFKIVIYANHLLRAAFPAMELVAEKILKNTRSFEIENKIIPIKKIINLIGND